VAATTASKPSSRRSSMITTQAVDLINIRQEPKMIMK